MSVAFLMLPRGRAKGIDMTSSLSSVFFDDYYDTKWDISFTNCSMGLLTCLPLINGIAQNEHGRSQPSDIFTYA